MANNEKIDNWPEVRRLAEQGVPFANLSKTFGVAGSTIYARSSREDWLIPSRVALKLQIAAERAEERRTTERLKAGNLSEKGTSILHETWENRAADIRQLAWEVSRQAIAESRGNIVLETASDLKAAVHVARQATGLLDTDAPAVQLSIFGGAESLLDEPVYDGYIEEPELSPENMETGNDSDWL